MCAMCELTISSHLKNTQGNIMQFRKTSTLLTATLCAGLFAAPVLAQNKPQVAPGYAGKPTRVLVSAGAGGGMDTITRAVASKLSDRLGITMLVDNVSGASGVIAVNTVINAAPDGHTLLSTSGSLPLNVAFKKLDAAVVKAGLQAVQQLSYQPYILIAKSDAPYNTIQEFIAYAKKNPGKLTYGSSGIGTPIHMGSELIEFGAGVDMLHVPYKGNAAAQVDMVAGRLDFTLSSISGLQLVRTGKAKALAITSLQRNPEVPDLPTIAETIIPGYEVTNAYMIYAPSKTPAAIVNGLNREIVVVLSDEDMKKRMIADASTPAPARSPQDWQKVLSSEIDRWDSVVKRANIKLED
jgi:tripartite-type tricarboxylate transporter receptor subunit TctC